MCKFVKLKSRLNLGKGGYSFKNLTHLLFSIVIFPLLLTTCDMPMGLGQPIDFEPPVLRIDPGPNPRYVTDSTIITGDCFDNIGVTRIVAFDARDRSKTLGEAVINGNRWSLALDLSNETDGTRIILEFVAYDAMGNSGEESIQTITIIVDRVEPIFSNLMIKRSNTRLVGFILPNELEAHKALNPALPVNADFFQNGAFRITASVIDEHTMVDPARTNLLVYDATEGRDVEGMELDLCIGIPCRHCGTRNDCGIPIAGTPALFPEWLITEGMLENAFTKKGLNYNQELLDKGRLYFRVSLVAYDLANNRGVRKDYDYFCINREADIPKVVITGASDTLLLSPGTPIPADFYEDDLLGGVWADMITLNQFNSYGLLLSPEQRINIILDKFKNGDIIENWKTERRTASNYANEEAYNRDRVFRNRVGVNLTDSMNLNVDTGTPNDYGDYIIIAVAKDKKGDYHQNADATGYDPSTDDTRAWPLWTIEWKYVTITDNNFPIIVVDTSEGSIDSIPAASTGRSPVENTFPILDSNNRFTINGYTLDENSQGRGEVVEFKIAWLPFRGGEGHTILSPANQAQYESFKNAMRTDNYAGFPGVQHWTLSDHTDTTKSSYFITGTQQDIGGRPYKKQTFKKTFSITGGTDDLNPAYSNFHFEGELENEPKLFVLFAKDFDGNESWKTIRLLGRKEPPELRILNLTSLVSKESHISNSITHYNDIRNLAFKTPGNYDPENLNEDYIMDTLAVYPRDTKIVLYANALTFGGIPIEEIKLYEQGKPNELLGFYNHDNQDLTFVVTLVDPQQKTYIFEAKNVLGKELPGQQSEGIAKINRTVSITSGAHMEEIVADLPSGTYGAGVNIKLSAQFTNQVDILPNPNTIPENQLPEMNVRYGSDIIGWTYTTAKFNIEQDLPTMYLEFIFTVPENSNGILETIHAGNANGGAERDRPITLRGAEIVDYERSDPAFMPGYTNIEWRADQSLRDKIISLDGVRPQLAEFTITARNTSGDITATGDYIYLKNMDIINFDLSTGTVKKIRPSGNNPRVVFRIREPNGNYLDNPEYNPETNEDIKNFYGNFTRINTEYGMIFNFNITNITLPNTIFTDTSQRGTVEVIGLCYNLGRIIDSAGNTLSYSNLNTLLNTCNKIRIDTKSPEPAVIRIDNTTSIRSFYNFNPELTLTSDSTENLWGTESLPWGTKLYYSLNNGREWVEYPDVKDGWTSKDATTQVITIDSNTGIGNWEFTTLQRDMAGNETRTPTVLLSINGEFPKITSIRILNPGGIYTRNATISIFLDFERPVRTHRYENPDLDPEDWAYIIVSDRTAFSTDYTERHTIKIPAVRIPRAQANPNGSTRTLRFDWALPTPARTGKEMANGLVITKICLTGDGTEIDIRDLFGNYGENSTDDIDLTTVTISHIDKEGASGTYTVPNLSAANVKIFNIPPELVDSYPKNAALTPNDPDVVLSGDRKTITLTFNSAMQKGVGTISIKPYGNDWPIPAVFPADGYWVDINGDRTAGPGPNNTYIESFYEVYSRMSSRDHQLAMQRGPRPGNPVVGPSNQRETGSGTFEDPTLHERTGLQVGPYKLSTQGLTQGAGFSASIDADIHAATPRVVTPRLIETAGNFTRYEIDGDEVDNPGWFIKGDNYMVPDISSKFVLDYQYGTIETQHTAGANDNINRNIRGVIANIRSALTDAKYRWTELEVASSNVQITGALRTTVTLTLDNPLPMGLRWDITWTEGALVNEAGLEAELPDNWWFWTDGVQPPVIRVDRKSLDHRASVLPAWTTNNGGGIDHSNTSAVNFNSFNTIDFRIDCETPNAEIKYDKLLGNKANLMGITAAWTDAASNIAAGGIQNWSTFPNTVTGLVVNNLTTSGTSTRNADPGSWVLPNLLRKSITGSWTAPNATTGLHFYEMDKGIITKRQGAGNLRLFRSYNKDATKAELDTLINGADYTDNLVNASGTDFINNNGANFPRLMASKNYIGAEARAPHVKQSTSTKRGYEGIFRTIVALRNTNQSNNDYFLVSGNQACLLYASNLPNGSPTIPGFPVQIGTGDLRYFRVMARDAGITQLLWISTEIVSPAYYSFRSNANGSTYFANGVSIFGDVGPFISGGYGELTYSYQQDVK